MLSSVEFVDKHKIFGKLYFYIKLIVDCALFSVFHIKFLCLWGCCESSRNCIFVIITTTGPQSMHTFAATQISNNMHLWMKVFDLRIIVFAVGSLEK